MINIQKFYSQFFWYAATKIWLESVHLFEFCVPHQLHTIVRLTTLKKKKNYFFGGGGQKTAKTIYLFRLRYVRLGSVWFGLIRLVWGVMQNFNIGPSRRLTWLILHIDIYTTYTLKNQQSNMWETLSYFCLTIPPLILRFTRFLRFNLSEHDKLGLEELTSWLLISRLWTNLFGEK